MKKYKLKKYGVAYFFMYWVVPALVLAFLSMDVDMTLADMKKDSPSDFVKVASEVPNGTTTEQKDYIDRTAEAYKLDPKVVKAIIKVESGGNVNAVGDNGNSVGLMQVQPRFNAHRLKQGESLLDPQVNVRVGCELLSELIEKYGTLDEALTAYNAGHDTGNREYANRVYEEMKNKKRAYP